jgi:hypothetical protein
MTCQRCESWLRLADCAYEEVIFFSGWHGFAKGHGLRANDVLVFKEDGGSFKMKCLAEAPPHGCQSLFFYAMLCDGVHLITLICFPSGDLTVQLNPCVYDTTDQWQT